MKTCLDDCIYGAEIVKKLIHFLFVEWRYFKKIIIFCTLGTVLNHKYKSQYFVLKNYMALVNTFAKHQHLYQVHHLVLDHVIHEDVLYVLLMLVQLINLIF